MNPSSIRGAFAAAAFGLLAGPALAHVSFENDEARPNATYKAVLRISHGCEGQPTRKVQVRIPEGVIGVKPMPKAGWTLETVTGPYVRAYDLNGQAVAEGVTGISWSGSLEDGHYDEFVFQAYITDVFQPGATIYFPVVQECAEGKHEWTQVPAAGQDPHALASPAPGLTIVTPAGSAETSPALARGLAIEQPWSRATPGGAKVAGGYVRITNRGQEPDRLVGGSFALAGRVELHEMRLEGDVMRMNPVEGGLEIKPGETVELKPGGYHLMFMDLREPLTAGRTVKGTLTFEKAGAVPVDYAVRPAGSPGAAPVDHKH